MDNCAIPFPCGRTKAEPLPGDRDEDSDQGTDTEAAWRKPMRLIIRLLDGNSTVVEAFATDSVLDLKQALQERLNFPAGQIHLVHHYETLVNSATLGESGVTDLSVILLILRMCGGDLPTYGEIVEKGPGYCLYNYVRPRAPPTEEGSGPIEAVMILQVKTAAGVHYLVDAVASETVENFKERLQDVVKLPPHVMRLIPLSVNPIKELADHRTIGDSGLKNGGCIYLIVRLQGGDGSEGAFNTMDIAVKLNIDIGSKLISVTAAPSDSVLSVKQSIEKEAGVPSAKQALWYRHELSDHKTLASYGIGGGSYLSLRLK